MNPSIATHHPTGNIPKRRLWFIIPLVLLTVSAIANVVMTARVSDLGTQIYALDIQRETLTKQNDKIEIELAAKQSAQALRERAIAGGYVPRTTVVVVQKGASLAAR